MNNNVCCICTVANVRTVARGTEGSSSARKRKRGYDAHDDNIGVQHAHGSSHDHMPPPLSRTRNVEHMQHAHAPVSSQLVAPPTSSQTALQRRLQQPDELPFRPPPPPARSSAVIQRRLNAWQPKASKDHYQDRDPATTRINPAQRFIRPSTHAQNMPTTPGHVQAAEILSKPVRFSNAFDDQRVPQFDEVCGTLAEQGFGQSRHKLPSGTVPTYNQSQPVHADEYTNYGHHLELVQPAAIRSPFFKTGNAYARPDSMRPPARGAYTQVRDGRQRVNSPFFGSGAPQDSSVSARLRGAAAEPSPSQFHQEHANPHQYSFAPPQTSQHSQLFHRQADCPPPSATSHAPTRPQTNTQRGRVSLPPHRSRMALLRGAQDGALSRIQGVRGLTSRQDQLPSYGPQPPAFEASRQLFSAAGARRSVRR